MLEEDLEILIGTVESIKYQNEENGYTVCSIEADDELITIVGNLPFVCVGEELKVQGKWKLHLNYGRQFNVEFCEKRLPVNETAILRYLSSGAVKGIGQVTAKRIVDLYGEKALEVIEENPEKLAVIRGISPSKANKISESFKQQFGVRSLLLFFQQYGITPSIALRIWKKWGSQSVDIIKDNPYLLCEEIYGIGFLKSDEIAVKMGIANDSPFRLKSGIKYVLKHNLTNGHTFLPKEKLVVASADVLEINLSLIEDYLDDLVLHGELFSVLDIGGKNAIYLSGFFKAEAYISGRITVMNELKDEKPKKLDEFIQETEKQSGIHYAENQREAIKESVLNRVMILTGGPGTGKTTTLKGMISLFEKLDFKVLLAAPTGRAAKRMEELTDREAKTIHRLLEMDFSNHDFAKFTRNENNPLNADVIIIDEVSMVDVILMEALLRALPNECKLIMVGDADQLPPVGAGNVLKDLIKSEMLKVVKLNEIFRQAEQSLIIVNAHKIIKGEKPDLSQKNNDFFYIKKNNSEEVLEAVVELCSKRLPQAYQYSPLTDIQVLSPTRKASTGTAMLNERLRDALNLPNENKKEKKVRDVVFRQGDKVMQSRNNYDICWQRDNGEAGTGIFNGDIGIIESFDFEFETAAIRFEDRVAIYEFDILDELEPAFAITVHKSQGSEFNVVILPLFDGPKMLFYRSLLYTAVTRAKKMLIIVGSEEKVYEMVRNNESSGRYTGLKYFLIKGGINS